MDYDALAPVYERVFGPEAADGTWHALEQLLLPALPPRARVLDLCCGTGEITARLLGKGFRVTGVDRSRAMLAYARQRAPRARFLEADMRKFRPEPGSFAAAVCVYNSLPHITSTRAIAEVLRKVRQALVPGGRFIFDLYPEEAFAAGWHGAHRAGPSVLAAAYDPATKRATTRVYWEGGRTTLCIRSYSEAELEQLLRESGLVIRARVLRDGRAYWMVESESGCGGRRSGRPRDRRH